MVGARRAGPLPLSIYPSEKLGGGKDQHAFHRPAIEWTEMLEITCEKMSGVRLDGGQENRPVLFW